MVNVFVKKYKIRFCICENNVVNSRGCYKRKSQLKRTRHSTNLRGKNDDDSFIEKNVELHQSTNVLKITKFFLFM